MAANYQDYPQQPGYYAQPPPTGYAQPPPTGYVQPPPGYAQPPQPVYTQPYPSNNQPIIILHNDNHDVQHGCHFILCFLTGGLWAPCWAAACLGLGCERPC
ncbi:unnamed protein product [Rotaria socialis]|uniref:Uncharacterized protein n=1 Tax=Rotaria socialis TaxID=392032 RepID=A0A817ZKG8_9BILA|nr:unnamed protein product [Rotaria socialis]CAF3358620.1 unnamed protein product [Rotaria socialis]CAF3375039.1 unnamed protein product [Rotaria socialis]CAF3394284.1 unnamed protein product [Rotaria socialis]CAF3648615.1 unnamed protein product [Rotaria socialis]